MQCTKALYSTPELSYVLGYYTWEYQFHALDLEELPICLAGIAQRSYQRMKCDTWSGGRSGPGFGMLSLGWRKHTMTSMCYSALWCLQDWRRDTLRQLTLKSMAALTTKGTTSPMVSIRSGLHLWRPFPIQVRRRDLTLLCVRRLVRRMSSGHLVCFSNVFVVKYPALTYWES
jgi:hypothetical protein